MVRPTSAMAAQQETGAGCGSTTAAAEDWRKMHARHGDGEPMRGARWPGAAKKQRRRRGEAGGSSCGGKAGSSCSSYYFFARVSANREGDEELGFAP
ncbi:hypothetical protein U1Q18_045500 [Sarracenia purpurea var. burkii]